MSRHSRLPDPLRLILLRYEVTECLILVYLLGTAQLCGFKLRNVH